MYNGVWRGKKYDLTEDLGRAITRGDYWTIDMTKSSEKVLYWHRLHDKGGLVVRWNRGVFMASFIHVERTVIISCVFVAVAKPFSEYPRSSAKAMYMQHQSPIKHQPKQRKQQVADISPELELEEARIELTRAKEESLRARKEAEEAKIELARSNLTTLYLNPPPGVLYQQQAALEGGA